MFQYAGFYVENVGQQHVDVKLKRKPLVTENGQKIPKDGKIKKMKKAAVKSSIYWLQEVGV